MVSRLLPVLVCVAALLGGDDAKVGDLGNPAVAVAGHENVVGLDVAMDHSVRVGGRQALGDAAGDLPAPGNLEGPWRWSEEVRRSGPSTISIEKKRESSSARSRSPQSTTLRLRTWRSVRPRAKAAW